MPFINTAFRVAIASPGDVREERRIIREVIHDWNAAHSETRGIVLLPVGWESNTTPLMGGRAQELINSQIIRSADLLVAAFWTRLGTPTGSSASGSVEEIEEFLGAGKPVMIYFSSAPVVPSSIDPEQYAGLQKFRKSCEKNGLIETYDSVAELKEKLTRQLALLVNSHETFAVDSKSPLASNSVDALVAAAQVITDPASSLSIEAKVLLDEATKDASGVLLVVKTMAGLSVETNRRSFVPEGDPRSAATYRDAVDELSRAEYVHAVGTKGEVFEVTRSGYEAADRLRRRSAGAA